MLAISTGLPQSGRPILTNLLSNVVTQASAGQVFLDLDSEPALKAWAGANNIIVTKMNAWKPAVSEVINGGGDVRIFLIVRDIRDIVFDLITYQGKSFDQARQSRVYVEFLENYHGWVDTVPEQRIVTIKYEELLADRANHAMRIAGFLDVPITMEAARHLAKLSRMGQPDTETKQWRGLPKDQIAAIEEDFRPWLVDLGYGLSS